MEAVFKPFGNTCPDVLDLDKYGKAMNTEDKIRMLQTLEDLWFSFWNDTRSALRMYVNYVFVFMWKCLSIPAWGFVQLLGKVCELLGKVLLWVLGSFVFAVVFSLCYIWIAIDELSELWSDAENPSNSFPNKFGEE